MSIKKLFSWILIICICLSIISNTVMATDKETEMDNGTIVMEIDDTVDGCFPEDNEILGVELSGDLEVDGVFQEDGLDGGEIDINSLSEAETDDSIQESLAEKTFVEVDSLEEELDGDVEQDLLPIVSDDIGNVDELQEISVDELLTINTDDELDGASSSTKGYKLTVSASKVIKGSKIKVSWTFKNGANHGTLYAIIDSRAYPVNVTGDGSKNLTLPTSGKWRICMIAYKKNGNCIYNGYKDSGGSLYVNVGTAPSGYGMSYSIQNKTRYVFKVSVNDTNNYDAVILKDGIEYSRKNFSGTTEYFSISPTKAGYYQVYLILYNNYGSYNGKTHNRILGFTCKAPGFYSWSISSKNIKLGEKVRFIISNLNNATSAELIILKNSKVVAKTQRFSGNRNVDYTPKDSGTYYAYMITYNEYGRL